MSIREDGVSGVCVCTCAFECKLKIGFVFSIVKLTLLHFPWFHCLVVLYKDDTGSKWVSELYNRTKHDTCKPLLLKNVKHPDSKG